MFDLFKKKEVVEKGDYVVVLHNWFVHSEGFKHFVFKGMDRKEVEVEAIVLKNKYDKQFSKCAYYVIKIDE